MRFYTRGLPTPVARRRIDEIDAELHDHIAHDRAHGMSERRIALSILSRMVRGAAADGSLRRQARPRKGHAVKLLRSLLAILAIAIGVAAIAYAQADDAPGLGLLGFLFIGGAVVLGVRTFQRSR